jgi:hypothetical protein
VVVCAAGREEACADGFAGAACGNCAGSDAHKTRLATTANGIGAKRGMWLIGRAAAVEVICCRGALCEQSNAREDWSVGVG